MFYRGSRGVSPPIQTKLPFSKDDIGHTVYFHSVVALTFSGDSSTSPNTVQIEEKERIRKERAVTGSLRGVEGRTGGSAESGPTRVCGRSQIEIGPEIRSGTFQMGKGKREKGKKKAPPPLQ